MNDLTKEIMQSACDLWSKQIDFAHLNERTVSAHFHRLHAQLNWLTGIGLLLLILDVVKLIRVW